MAHERVVLFLAYSYPPENEIAAARTHRFARYLPEYGYKVRVLSSGEFPGPAPDPPAWRSPRRVAWWEKPIRKFVLPGEEGFSWVTETSRAAEQFGEKYVAVLSSAPPIGPHLAAGRIAGRKGIPWVADFRDPLAGSPVRTAGMMKWVDPLLEKWVVKRASAVTVVTNVLHQQICERHPGQEEKFHLLWNGFDPQRVHRPELHPESERRRLLHLGSLYDVRNPNRLLQALARLIQNGRVAAAAAEIRLIGHLDPEFELACPEVWSYLKEKGALTVVAGQQPPAMARQEMEKADSLLLVDTNPGGIGYAMPGKLFEYVPAGRPIVAMTVRGAPAAWMLQQSGVPSVFLYADGDGTQAEQAVLDWLAVPRGKYEPSAWFWETFDGKRQVGQLAGILDRVTG